uniref:Uncharacterized protein n=1 Tax=Sphaerodactylus townsendi TaxID=933632 RepID=A0ACB8FI29_9SAUR
MHHVNLLKSAGFQIADDDVNAIILYSLSRSYANEVFVLVTRDSVDVDYTLTFLRDEFEKRPENAISVRMSVLKLGNFAKWKSVRCFVCGKTGHIARFCKQEWAGTNRSARKSDHDKRMYLNNKGHVILTF